MTFLGKASVTKGVHDILNAYKRVSNTDSELLFVGEGIEYDNLRKRIIEENISNVYFMDPIPPWRVPSLLKSSTALLVAERDFPIPNHSTRKPMEAMACRIPVIISSEVKSKRTYMELKEGEECLVVDPKNTIEFSQKLEQILKNESLCKTIGQNGYEFARKRNNYPQYVSEIEEFLGNITKIIKE